MDFKLFDMKKLLTILITILFSALLSAQNLEFNQVKLVSALETVPVGKVWKVTNVLPSTGAYNSNVDIKVNNTLVRVKSRDYYNQTNSNYTPSMSSWTTLNGAYWLPAGTTLEKDGNCEYISVIEFNTQ